MIVEIALGLNDLTDADAVIFGGNIHTDMTGNVYFNTPEIIAMLDDLKKAIDDLTSKLNAVESTTKTGDIITSRDNFDRIVKRISHKVYDIANDVKVLDINREVIVHSAGLTVKDKATHEGGHFKVEMDTTPGSIILHAKGGFRAHEWKRFKVSDQTKNETHLDATTKANTIDKGLTKGEEYGYYHRPVMPDKPADWEGPIYLMINK